MTFEQWIQAASKDVSLQESETSTALSRVLEVPDEDYGEEEDL